jgi:S1-C subfamily serine protease
MKQLIFLLVFGLCSCAHFQEQETLKQRLQENQSAVIITVYTTITDAELEISRPASWSGTGFSVSNNEDGNSSIISNKHVCAAGDNAKYVITDYKGEKHAGTFVRSAPGADLCLLTVDVIIPPVKLSAKDAVKGESINCIGAPLGMAPHFSDGKINGYMWFDMKDEESKETAHETHFMAQSTSVPIYPGSSGSACWNIDGEVIGVVFALDTRADHITFIVPVNEVHRFLSTEQNIYNAKPPTP